MNPSGSTPWHDLNILLTIIGAASRAFLAQLTPAGSNRFEGKTNAGQDVALSRWRMIRKSGNRFSGKVMLNQRDGIVIRSNLVGT
jgi:hypothetical protein